MTIRTISRRSFVAGSLVLTLSRFVTPVCAKALTADDPLGIGLGTPVADQATVETVSAFAQAFLEHINAADGSAANYLSQNMLNQYGGYDAAWAYYAGGAFPTEFFGVQNVLSYGSGHLSVEVNYSGGSVPGWYNTQRFYVLPVDGGFVLDYVQVLEATVIDGLSNTAIDVMVSDAGITTSAAEVSTSDVLVLNMINTSMTDILSVGVYVLPEGVDPVAAQSQLVMEEQSGIPAAQLSYEWLGGAPVKIATAEGPETRRYAFMVQPGTTYLLQQYVLGGDSVYYPMEGDSYVTMVTVVPELTGTPEVPEA